MKDKEAFVRFRQNTVSGSLFKLIGFVGKVSKLRCILSYSYYLMIGR